MFLLFAGIRRVVLAIKYGGIIRSIGNLDKKAKEIEALGEEVSKSSLSFDKNIERKHRNLEMEAQAERAYGGFLLKYRKLKNGVVRYYIFLFMAVAMLAGGLYLDGSIDLTKESLQKQVSIVMTKGGKKDTHKKKNDNADTIYVVSVSNARLRTGPGTSYETLNGYDNGSEVVLTGEKQSDGSHIWYKVTAEDGTVGWMRSDMIKESK